MSATSPIPSLSGSQPVVLIRVIARGYSTPNWYILGTHDEYEFEYYCGYGKDLVLGEQSTGEHILDVTDLGLDPAACLAYLEAHDRIEDLYQEEDAFNLHSDPDGKCLCGEIAEQRAIGDAIKKVIMSAVLARFDSWTRRCHLVALADKAGMFAPSNYPNTKAELDEPVTDHPPWAGAEWLMTP